jgi:hypothetical protein
LAKKPLRGQGMEVTWLRWSPSVLLGTNALYLAAAKVKGVSRKHELYARKRAWWLANDTVREHPKPQKPVTYKSFALRSAAELHNNARAIR